MGKKLLFFWFTILSISVYSQNKIATIVDAQTGETIPYANIKIGNESQLVSNSEGKFNISEKHDNSSTTLLVSYIGYETQQLTLGKLENQKYIIRLVPGVYELDNVDVTNKKADVVSIMAKVKANLKENYSYPSTPLSTTIFLRDQNSFKAKQFNIEIDKSTGFTKSKLKEVNAEIKSFASKMKKNPPREYQDLMGVYSTSFTSKEGKAFLSNKLNVLKATKIKDENRSVSLEDMEVIAAQLFLKHLDTTKFYRIKSGWFGSRDTISFSKSYNDKKHKAKKKKDAETRNVSAVKSSIYTVQNNTSPIYGKNTSFMRQTDWYHYTLDGAIFTNDYKLVYVIKFKPKKSKAKYEGTLYVSENDFAVIKATYKLAEGKTLDGLNLKLLLGIKFRDNVSSGTLIYKENAETKKYHLQYANLEEGQYFYVNRPIKFIELTDKDRDVLALDLKAEGDVTDKIEYLSLDTKVISESEFEKIKQPDFQYLRMKKYDPKVWKEFTTLEPVQEMKQFSITEN